MHSLQPNGLKVLDLIPGLVDKIPKYAIQEAVLYSSLPEDERELARYGMYLQKLAGHTVNGVRRPAFLRVLIEEAQAQGVPVRRTSRKCVSHNNTYREQQTLQR